MKLPTIFRSKRHANLAGSLNTSASLSRRLWSSSSNPKARPCMPNGFRSRMARPQLSGDEMARAPDLQEFKSIQHWQETDTQFFHEFLLILLTDGSVCRVERLGEGSRADAVRRIGCTAHDLIQWFSPNDHTAKKWSQGPQEMIVQVDFPRTFELLDILAVCHTIQHKSRRASAYTLQRYNCYFLCNTILAVLSRRLAEWEISITDTDWPGAVDNMIEKLKRTSLILEEQFALEFFSFGICSLLDPDNPDPAGFLLEYKRSELKGGTCDEINQNLANTLWHKDTEKAIAFPVVMCNLDGVLKESLPNSTAHSFCT